MNTQKYNKLKKLLQMWAEGTVATQEWLTQIGISRFSVREYIKSGWVRSIGNGVVIRYQEKLNFNGALYALQHQLSLPVHLGAMSALIMHGRAHYIKNNELSYDLFVPSATRLPRWFLNLNEVEFNNSVKIYKTNFLNAGEFIQEYGIKEGISILISTIERAVFEILFQTPEVITFFEANYIFENLSQLRPSVVQQLLERCKSKKVKRLFLTYASIHNHPWLKELDIEKIDIGKGILSFAKGGLYYKPYKVIIPKELIKNESQTLF